MSQSHFTLGFPLETAVGPQGFVGSADSDDAGAVPGGRRHRHGALLALHGVEREDAALPRRLRRRVRAAHAGAGQAAGPVFDAIFKHVNAPPPRRSPITRKRSSNGRRNISSIRFSTPPTPMRPPRRSRPWRPPRTSRRRRGNLFLVILPAKSRLAFVEMQIDPAREGSRQRRRPGQGRHAPFRPVRSLGGQADGLLHRLRRLVRQVHRRLHPEHRGSLRSLLQIHQGPAPSPCRKHVQEFIDFAAGANRTPIGFYQAYPGLTVQDIKALIADSKWQAAAGSIADVRGARRGATVRNRSARNMP